MRRDPHMWGHFQRASPIVAGLAFMINGQPDYSSALMATIAIAVATNADTNVTSLPKELTQRAPRGRRL